jgi:hypothetical protein
MAQTRTSPAPPNPFPVPSAMSRGAEELETGADACPTSNSAGSAVTLTGESTVAQVPTAMLIADDVLNEEAREALFDEARLAHEATYHQ